METAAEEKAHERRRIASVTSGDWLGVRQKVSDLHREFVDHHGHHPDELFLTRRDWITLGKPTHMDYAEVVKTDAASTHFA